MVAMAIAYPEDSISQHSSTFCSSYTFSVPSSKMVPESWGAGMIQMSHLGLNTQQSSILIASTSYESLDLLSPTEKRSFSGQG